MYFPNEENGRPTVKGLNFQTKLQKKLVDLYSDSAQIDTTLATKEFSERTHSISPQDFSLSQQQISLTNPFSFFYSKM
eukprot:snap_masked-scaffold_21-processed-gene-4.27-mRNA-1 protein AED:1.00 eAED:1.00 QI:0/0/0/0/1/1/2/0/77